ncbi:MAG TPA: D-2-hydroxyacid dehydrogenase [Myxococcota bacterium]
MSGALLVSAEVEERWGAALSAAAPGLSRVVVAPGRGVRGDPASVELAYFSGDLFPDRVRDFALALRDAPRLRWLHTFSAGVDHPWFQALRARGVRLTTSSGAHASPIAQTVLLYLLALSRDLPAWMDAQRRRAWEPHEIRELTGLLLGVVGMGPIGLEVARLAQACGMQVIGVRRTPRGDEPCETWPLARLDELVARADALVLALPLTDETRRLFDAARLARTKRGAWLVNVGRGALVDEPALVEALRTGRLGGAALDVFETEPLPPESPLWAMPNVIVTPHNSGDAPGNRVRATEIFLDNLGRWTRGEPLRNEVP